MSGRIAISVLLLSVCVFISELNAGAVTQQPPLNTFQMRSELIGQHPRLFFTTADIPALQQKAQTTHKVWIDQARSAHGGRTSLGLNLDGDWHGYLHLWAGSVKCILWNLEGNTTYRNTAKTWAMQLVQNHWWIKDDLINMDAMSGLAIYYDMLYDQFTESERQQIRASLYEGIQFIAARFFVDQYWTNDYQNNHCHNRLQALALASWAMYGDDPAYNVQQYADLAMEGVNNLIAWLPEDGSNHEGPGYWSFGSHWVERTMTAAEHVTGLDLTGQNTHFANSAYYKIYMQAPDWLHTFRVGDAGGHGIDNSTAVAAGVSLSGDPFLQSVLQNWLSNQRSTFYQQPIWGLFWYDGNLQPQSYTNMPLYHFWPDLEMFTIRDSWDSNALSVLFKCGPLGGHKMQQIRGSSYINVAHDHPDQNHFGIYYKGKMMATDDGYPKDKKLARSHNTLQIDNAGQPREGGPWSQPFDYSLSGYMEDVFLSGNSAYASGNGSKLYTGVSRFVRHFAFIRGDYLLIIDDLIGTGSSTANHLYDWRLHKTGTWTEFSNNHYQVVDGTAKLDINLLSPAANELDDAILSPESTAEHALSMKHTAHEAKYISLIVPHSSSQVPITGEIMDDATNAWALEMTGPDFTDYYAVSQSTGDIAFGPITSDGVHAMLRVSNQAIESAMMTRGTEMQFYGSLIFSASADANISFRRDNGLAIFDVETPYKTTGGYTLVRLGQLTPNVAHTVSINGQVGTSPVADAQGIITLYLDLSERKEISVVMEEVPFAAVADSHVFYNNSAFDGNDPAANAADDQAIAIDKQLLRSGETASFANYTSYDKGINGIMLDVINLAGDPTLADFEFAVGNDDTPGSWAAGPAATSITIRPGEGTQGSDRVSLTFADGAIRKQWLKVTMKANANTGLLGDQVFYIGNAPGDCGDQTGNSIVDATDEIGARNNPRAFHKPAGIDFAYDYNRDGKVDATDQIIARNNTSTMSTSLQLITAP